MPFKLTCKWTFVEKRCCVANMKQPWAIVDASISYQSWGSYSSLFCFWSYSTAVNVNSFSFSHHDLPSPFATYDYCSCQSMLCKKRPDYIGVLLPAFDWKPLEVGSRNQRRWLATRTASASSWSQLTWEVEGATAIPSRAPFSWLLAPSCQPNTGPVFIEQHTARNIIYFLIHIHSYHSYHININIFSPCIVWCHIHFD